MMYAVNTDEITKLYYKISAIKIYKNQKITNKKE